MKNCILKRIFFIIALLGLIIIPIHLCSYNESIGIIMLLQAVWVCFGALLIYSLTEGHICLINDHVRHDLKFITDYPDFVEHI